MLTIGFVRAEDTTNNPPSIYSTNAPVSTNAMAVAGDTRETKYLSLDECISMALKHNLDIQVQAYNPKISGFALAGVYGSYEPAFGFSFKKSYVDNPAGPGIDPNTSLPYKSSIGEADNYSPSITGLLPFGTTYTLSGNLSRNRTISPLDNPAQFSPPIFNPATEIVLTQPLLQNFWIDRTRLQIRLDKNFIKSSQAALLMQVMNTVTSIKSAYFNLLYNIGNVQANATAYKLAPQLVEENRTRVKVGSLAPLDEKQSESQAAASLAAMQLAESQLGTQQNTLKSLMTDDFSKWSDVTLVPSEKLEVNPANLNLQESWRLAMSQRPDLKEAKIKVESQNVQLKYDFNQRFPQLDINGSYGRQALDGGLYESLGSIQQGNHSFYSYGLQATIPLGGNISAKNTYKADKSTLKQLLLQLKQVEQNIIVAVQNDVGTVRSSLQQVYSTRDARVYAEAALDAEQKKLENGKSTSFIVLQLINSLTAARVSEIQALANYNIALAQLALDEGSTLDVNHIKFDVR